MRALSFLRDCGRQLRDNLTPCLAKAILAATILSLGCDAFHRSTGRGVITIDRERSFQRFVGWQVTGETGINDMVSSGKLYSDAVLDAAVEAGINRIRIGIGSGLTENSVDY